MDREIQNDEAPKLRQLHWDNFCFIFAFMIVITVIILYIFFFI
jgi:hypothetical protein